MNHLRDAKTYARQAESVSTQRMQANAQLATAHALIAIAERLELDGIEYNETFGEYIAVAMTGEMVFGQTRQQCYDNLREANRAWIEHCQKCQEDRDGQNSRA